MEAEFFKFAIVFLNLSFNKQNMAYCGFFTYEPRYYELIQKINKMISVIFLGALHGEKQKKDNSIIVHLLHFAHLTHRIIKSI